MRSLKLTIMGCLALAMAPAAADAAIRYSFVGAADFFITDVSFVYVAPDFIDISGGAIDEILLADLESMTTVPATGLLGVSFYDIGFGDTISIDATAFGLGYYFAPGTFLHLGTYTAYTGAGVGTLVISAAGVPEPAVWSLMIGGFAAIGQAMRRGRKLAAA